ncbi:hypothetical protein C1H76_4922 [Elsinoe australis]|uniref:Uncharacterized protein n=1 Tax=Elsinoe australis TaxID=40998 RepID=A0A4U7B619_9PEZI|nr:hypothetical protein C1H76_4922 [Elsinoe australis]
MSVALYTNTRLSYGTSGPGYEIGKDRGTIPVQSTEPSPRILKTPNEQEAANYIAAPHDDLIGMLAESTAEHHFVFAGKSDISAPERREIIEKSLRLPSTTRILPDVGHL